MPDIEIIEERFENFSIELVQIVRKYTNTFMHFGVIVSIYRAYPLPKESSQPIVPSTTGSM
jgi:hypothetical protein